MTSLNCEQLCTISDTYFVFLATWLSIHHSALNTGIYYKPTDSHSYLNVSSYQPTHTNLSVSNSQFLRQHGLSSNNDDFETQSQLTTHHIILRGYLLTTMHASFDFYGLRLYTLSPCPPSSCPSHLKTSHPAPPMHHSPSIPVPPVRLVLFTYLPQPIPSLLQTIPNLRDLGVDSFLMNPNLTTWPVSLLPLMLLHSAPPI